MNKIMAGAQCPFCGSTEQRITCEKAYLKLNDGCICISCDCGCDLWLFDKAETPYNEAVKKAVEKWQTRVKALDIP